MVNSTKRGLGCPPTSYRNGAFVHTKALLAGAMKPLNILSKIRKSFCDQDRPFSSFTWCGRLFFFAQEVFEFAIAASRASRYHLASFEPDFLQIQLQNTCWASPKPDVQHKNALISHLNDRWISKFLGEKFVLLKSSLIHLISHKTGTITSGFEGKKRKYHLLKFECYYDMLYPELFTRTGPPKSGFLPQNRTWYVLKTLVWLWYAFYNSSSNLENRMTVCMGYPAMTRRRAGKRRREGAGSPCRENGTQNPKSRWYEKPEPVVPILPWNSLRIF